jgi:hypothetical protein
MNQDESYNGELSSSEMPRTERRRHRVYVTRNTEYHFRDGVCLAVRSRQNGEFLQGHLAIGRRSQGSLQFVAGGGFVPNVGEPKPGEGLFFDANGRELLTSAILRVERPTADLVRAYPKRPVRPLRSA